MVAAVFAAAPAGAAKRYIWGSGHAGGAWGTGVQAGAQLLNKELKGKYQFQNVPGQSAVSNVRRANNGEFDFAWTTIIQVRQGWKGVGPFKKDGKLRDFRVVARVRRHTQIFVVNADSSIKSFSDFKGKVVNMSPRNSGSNKGCLNFLKGLGLLGKIKQRNLSFTAAARGLGDRQIDVFCSGGSPGLPIITQLAARRALRYISLSVEEQKKLTTKFRAYSPYTIPPSKSMRLKTPIRSVGFDALWLANKNVPDDVVYQALKITGMPENVKKLVKVIFYWSDVQGDFRALEKDKILLHPAAARYWRERGFKFSNGIVPGS
jgi:TRAP transporter TAXI family solute receptor